jgi:hypothetical protein
VRTGAFARPAARSEALAVRTANVGKRDVGKQRRHNRYSSAMASSTFITLYRSRQGILAEHRGRLHLCVFPDDLLTREDLHEYVGQLIREMKALQP